MEITFGMVTDGSSETILAVHANRSTAIAWTKPADIPFDVKKPVTQLAKSEDGTVRFVLCDGSPLSLSNDKVAGELPYLIKMNDAHVIRSLE